MLFVITTLTEYGGRHEFSFNAPYLEAGLEQVNRLSCHNYLLKVSLIEDTSRMELPVEVFDGSSFSEPLGQLQHQWEQALVIFSPPPICSQQDKLLQRAVEARQNRIDRLKRTKKSMQLLLDKAVAMRHKQATLIHHYENIIAYCNRYLAIIDSDPR